MLLIIMVIFEPNKCHSNMLLSDTKTEEPLVHIKYKSLCNTFPSPHLTCCLGLDVVGCDLHAAVVNGRPPPECHAPLIVVSHIRLARGQGHG